MSRAIAWWTAAVFALLLFAWPGPAGAAVPPTLAGQVADLRSGTAILHYDSPRARQKAAFERRLRRTGVRTVFFERLRLVAVRGNAAQLRRAARLRGVRSAHMDQRLKFHLHESVPLVYGDQHQATWDSGLDGRGGAVAVIDSGVDGLHPDLMGRMTANVKVLDPGDIFDEGEPVFLECATACSTDTTGGHGTHVAGTVAGDGTVSSGFYRGVAPGAQLVGLGVGEGITVLYALGAFEWIAANHAEYGIVAVNNSWGPVSDGVRFDGTDPINIATKALTNAGITVVFSAGNSGPDQSDCSTVPDGSGGREASDGACFINPYGVAPWTVSVANGRKDKGFSAAEQHLDLSSSRGDPDPQVSLDGQTIEYMPTLTAPGTNIRATRMLAGVNTTTPIACGLVAEPPACVPPQGAAQYEPFYMPLSGTSMASPHVAGAVAVIQGAALAELGRRLTPAEVRQVLTDSATTMTQRDGYFSWTCANPPPFRQCGDTMDGRLTGQPYVRWQVGAGYLNVTAAIARATQPPPAPAPDPTPTPTPAPTPGGGGSTPPANPPAGTPPPGPTQPAQPLPPPAQGGNQPDPQPTTLPPANQQGSGNGTAQPDTRAPVNRRAYRRCVKRANRIERGSRKQTQRARTRAKARCRSRYLR